MTSYNWSYQFIIITPLICFYMADRCYFNTVRFVSKLASNAATNLIYRVISLMDVDEITRVILALSHF